jgi:hypothetical protein
MTASGRVNSLLSCTSIFGEEGSVYVRVMDQGNGISLFRRFDGW